MKPPLYLTTISLNEFIISKTGCLLKQNFIVTQYNNLLKFLFLYFADFLQDLKQNKEIYLSVTEGNKKQAALTKIQRSLVKCQETGDEKLQIVSGIMEQIENRSRQLEQNLENLGTANCNMHFCI